MSFPAQICLTNTGNTQLGPVFYAYSDVDGYSSVFNNNVLLVDIIESSCPYTLEVPDNTSTVLLKDINTGCCVYIPLDSTIDLCIICDIGFNEYSANTVSVISVGDLTGSCENNITDYKVNWYGPDSSTNIQFTSGKGTNFTYDWTHPLTGNSSVFAPPGVYVPEVESVILNGATLQETQGALSNCFLPITVTPFNCSNGNSPIAKYSHLLEFSNTSQGNTPPNLSAEFILSSTTKFFSYAYLAESFSDTLKITYSGSNYEVPLVIEYLTLGDVTSPTNFDPDVFPKTGDSQFYFTKVLCLTGITYASGDKLIIEIIPNESVLNTIWKLYFKCMETFDCVKCYDTNTPYKIRQSTITGITASCETISVNFSISGCSYEDNNVDVVNYMTGEGVGQTSEYGFELATNSMAGGTPYSLGPLFNSSVLCQQASVYNESLACFNGTNYSIYYRSYRPDASTRLIEMKFEDISDFTAYTTSFNTAIFYSGSTDPLSLNYYRNLRLIIPVPDGQQCGDSTIKKFLRFHPSTVVFTTGTTLEFPFNYTINISATTITDQINLDECLLNCNSNVDSIVSSINNTIQSSFFDFTGLTTNSSRLIYPFNQVQRVTSAQTSVNITDTLGYLNITSYSNNTYVASGNPLVNISELSATTCDLFATMSQTNLPSFDYYRFRQYVFYYRVQLTNPLDIRDFDIYASPIVNGAYNGFPYSAIFSDLVYSISGGIVTFTNPAYLI